MPKFSDTSQSRLITCHPDLQHVAMTAIQAVDFGITCGWRDKAAQDAAYPKYTRVKWPDSLHNREKNGLPCSYAFDFLPYDPAKHAFVAWDDYEMFSYVVGHILMTGYLLGIELRWGHDWNRNDSVSDEGFVDRPHVELVGYK